MKYKTETTEIIADGTFGHQHCREALARFPEVDQYEDIRVSLLCDMPDDAWDEIEALAILNECTDDDCQFTFQNGDLVLCKQ